MRSGDGAAGLRARPPARAATAVSTSRATMRPWGPDGTMRPRSMPASPAIRRANGVTTTPLGSFAGPKLRSGVRTSRKGSSMMGGVGGTVYAGEGCVGNTIGVRGKPGESGGTGPTDFDAGAVVAPAAPERTATTAPTGATSPASTRISSSTPAAVAGTSMDTLSVSISNRLSPGLTASPIALNQVVILPSATVSPSCGIRISMGVAPFRRQRTDDRGQTTEDRSDLPAVVCHPSSDIRLPVHRYVLGF